MAVAIPCARCGDEIGAGHDRVRVDAELVPDGGDPSTYWLHPRCWSKVSAEWTGGGE